MKIAYVYLLRSLETGKFYLGWTTDLQRRLKEHNSGKSQYTKYRGPWKLVGYETYHNPQTAKKRERALKHNPRMLYYFKKRALASLSHHLFLVSKANAPSGHKQVVGLRDPTTSGWWDRQVVG